MIVLNADDYALSDDVDRAVTALADAHRLSATSVMANMPRWPESAGALARRRDRLAVGLHLTLTEGRPLSDAARAALTIESGEFISLRDLITRALLGRLIAIDIAAEVRAQLDAFAAAFGHLPDFIDGHQHVHVLPGVRDGLLAALRDTTWPSPPLIRSPTNLKAGPRDPVTATPKRWIAGLLATGFRTRLTRAGLPTNDTFAGFSTFRPGNVANDELSRALGPGSDDLHLVMCHPAAPPSKTAGPSTNDPLAARRIDEFEALMAMPDLPEKIWHPARGDHGAIDWSRAAASPAAHASAGTPRTAVGEARSP